MFKNGDLDKKKKEKKKEGNRVYINCYENIIYLI